MPRPKPPPPFAAVGIAPRVRFLPGKIWTKSTASPPPKRPEGASSRAPRPARSAFARGRKRSTTAGGWSSETEGGDGRPIRKPDATSETAPNFGKRRFPRRRVPAVAPRANHARPSAAARSSERTRHGPTRSRRLHRGSTAVLVQIFQGRTCASGARSTAGKGGFIAMGCFET